MYKNWKSSHVEENGCVQNIFPPKGKKTGRVCKKQVQKVREQKIYVQLVCAS